MSTATAKKTKTEAKAVEQDYQAIYQLVADSLLKDADYREAIEKRTELQNKLAALIAELDQLRAAVDTDSGELADRILSGDDLNSLESVHARHQALAQKVEAYRVAVAKQEGAIAAAKANAMNKTIEAVQPIYQQRIERFMAAIAEFMDSRQLIVELAQALTYQGVIGSGGLNFPNLQAINQTVNILQNTLREFQAR